LKCRSDFNGFVKGPTSALRSILRFFKVRKVRIITQDLRALPILYDWWSFFLCHRNLTFYGCINFKGMSVPYKPAFAEDIALEIIKKGVGSHFDPEIYEVFMSLLPAFAEIQEQLQPG
jgi:hypothetical protein